MVKKKLLLLISATILIIVAVSYSIYHYQHSATPPTLYGNVDIRTVNLAFRVNGRLASLNVDEGDIVKPGELLGKLDDSPYQNALRLAKANVAAFGAQYDLLLAGYRIEEIEQGKAMVKLQQAALAYAEKFYLRQQELWQSKATSRNELDNARSARDQAAAQLKAYQEQLDQLNNGNRPQQIAQAKAELLQAEAAQAQAELDLADTQLYSPSPGTVLTRAVEPGSMLNANNTVLALSLTAPVWIRAYIDERYLHQAVPGKQLLIYTDGRPETPYHAQVGFVSPTAEFTPKTVQTTELRTDLVYRLRLIVSDPDEGLRQGMPVTIKFPAD